jgi:CheY-like chemotaxis protein
LLLTFEVEDTGIGIAAEDQARIFDAFVQLGNPGRQKGTGLGLAITRRFVQLMGGTIWVESTPGRGSGFRVEVPVERAPELEVSVGTDWDRIVGLEPAQRDCRVLIVEDEQENRIVLERLLQNAGFLVRLAEDGARGVEMFQSWSPHFIWMDLRMPGMDGIEATRRIRALNGGREVKIAAVTASGLEGERKEVLAAGLDDYVRKPWRPNEIFECMARHLGIRYRRAAPSRAPSKSPDWAMRPERLAALPPGLVAREFPAQSSGSVSATAHLRPFWRTIRNGTRIQQS